jgi:hypothetical protein
MIQDINGIKIQRNNLFYHLDEVNSFKNKYGNIFEQYVEKEEIKDILEQTIADKNLFLLLEEKIENLISYELLKILGKTEKEITDDANYYLITNLIKYMILYKVKGGLINKWFKGINKCLIIV